MDISALLSIDMGFYVGIKLWLLLKPLYSIGSMSFELTSNICRSSYAPYGIIVQQRPQPTSECSGPIKCAGRATAFYIPGLNLQTFSNVNLMLFLVRYNLV